MTLFPIEVLSSISKVNVVGNSLYGLSVAFSLVLMFFVSTKVVFGFLAHSSKGDTGVGATSLVFLSGCAVGSIGR